MKQGTIQIVQHIIIGQDLGDAASLLGGTFEMAQGTSNTVVGALAAPESAGVSLPIAAAGVAEFAHGVVMSFSAGKNLGSQKGRVSEKQPEGSGTSSSNTEYKKRNRELEKIKLMMFQLELMEKGLLKEKAVKILQNDYSMINLDENQLQRR